MVALEAKSPAPSSRAAPAKESDRVLVEACLAGKKSAWDRLVDRYGRLVYSIPRRLGLQANDADDVFQSVFSAAIGSLSKLRHAERLASWLIRIAYRESWRVSRSARRVRAAHSVACAAEPPVTEIAQLEREQLVRQAMRRLRPAARRLLTTLYFEPHSSYSQAAGKLGYSIGSIGPLRARAFRELEQELVCLGFDETRCRLNTQGDPPV